MIQIVGFMVAAYGVARLLQTSELFEKSGRQLVGIIGAGALILLAVLLQQQAEAIGSLLG